MKKYLTGFAILVAVLVGVGILLFGAINEHEQHRPESTAGYIIGAAIVILGGLILFWIRPDQNTF